MTKSVCIIGAGPSGLVAAKTLLHNAPKSTFEVTIFDSKSRVAGLWPTSRSDFDGVVHPLMSTNISKHMQVFSDLAWHPDTPEFPRAWMVGRYLQRYVAKYTGAFIKLGHRVIRTELNANRTWNVTVREVENGVETALTFDHIIVASGFFGTPRVPSDIPPSPSVPVIHSTKYRDLNSLLGTLAPRQGKIVVVGGQLSGVETAATIAMHISSMKNLPGHTPVPTDLSVHHLVQRPTWIFPPYLPAQPRSPESSSTTTPASPFVPMDLVFGNRNMRAENLTNTQGHITPEAAARITNLYQSYLGDQGLTSEALKIPSEARSNPPQLAISGFYSGFVRAGQIDISTGYFNGLDGTTVTLSTGETITNVAAVVFATGFDAAANISLLPEAVLKAISYKPENRNMPVALGFHGVHHPDFETLGFVGFYRSPYWSVMEMQARVLAALWSPSNSRPASLLEALKNDVSLAQAQALQSDPRCSQFPMGDAMYITAQYASALGLSLHDPVGPCLSVAGYLDKSMDIMVPSRYISAYASKDSIDENKAALEQAYSDVRSALSGTKNIAGAVFRDLLGTWKLERSLDSKSPSYPSGQFNGTATFSIRAGTSHGLKLTQSIDELTESKDEAHDELTAQSRLDFITEYVYYETGTFTASNGLEFQASRHYIWRYDEVDDALSVWFASTKDSLEVDYLFHNVKFQPLVDKETGLTSSKWRANAGHLCIDDFYSAEYEFNFNGVNLHDWCLAYGVKGPNKDYRLAASYTRI
ncbi:pyridine nucleotide-disulfide [Ceratocystis lukuohia]|uniref:Pyridine nucleotide-disulfide n=1 Tax=Ceratocystis lukuohia TaxID=2019550 RepID=A0ABR4MB55_9PEZI